MKRDDRLKKLKESVTAKYKKMLRRDIVDEALRLHIWKFQAQEYIKELERQLNEVGGVL